jgi:hypothetical protein
VHSRSLPRPPLLSSMVLGQALRGECLRTHSIQKSMYIYANQKQRAKARYQQETDDFIRSVGFQALPRALGIMALGMTTSRSPFFGWLFHMAKLGLPLKLPFFILPNGDKILSLG